MAKQPPRSPMIKGWNPPTTKPAPGPKNLREQVRNKGTGKPRSGGWTPGKKPGTGLMGL